MRLLKDPSFNPKIEVYALVMEYVVEESREHNGIYMAFAFNADGNEEIYIALFPGPKSKQLAQEYAEWKNKQLKKVAA